MFLCSGAVKIIWTACTVISHLLMLPLGIPDRDLHPNKQIIYCVALNLYSYLQPSEFIFQLFPSMLIFCLGLIFVVCLNVVAGCLFLLQHCAVASLHPKRKQVTELLLRKGANVNEKNKEYVHSLK